MEQQLRQEINLQLKKVNFGNAPKMHERLKTSSGYDEIEHRIIMMVIKDKITPSSCIPHIESEL